MLSDFRFSRGGVLGQVLGFSALIALLFVAGCGSSNTPTIGPPAKLAFATQPSSASAGSMIAPAVTVSIEDAQGNVVTTATNQVTIAIGTNPSSGTLAGTAQASAVAGVATFSSLSINNAGTGYTLAASATGLTGATSSAFNVVGPPAKLAFTVQPGNVAAGSSITPAVAVSVEDAAGNVVPTATNQITIAIGTNPSSGTLSGTAQANAVAGVATFSNLSIDRVGTGYTLAANATGLTSAASGAFNVTAGAAAKLAFTVQPSNTTGGVAVSPAVQVTIEDSQGNTVATATNQITIAIGTNPSNGALSGTAQANAVAGVATFSNLSINSAGTGYTLTANATGLTAATSSSFNILVGPAAKLAFTVQPVNTGAAATITPAVAVSVEDAAGNVVTAATNQITIAIGTNPPPGGTLSGTTQVNAAAGVATFSTLSINNTGIGYTLTASATGLTGATSSAFNIFGAATKLAFTVQPSNVSPASSITPAVQVTIEDSQGSTVTTATNQITIAIGTNPPPGGTLSGTAQVNAVAGVATFSNLSINNAGTGYTLTASATGLTGATSSPFNVAASCGTSCSISGTVTGPVVAGVTITLSGGPSSPAPATTNSGGSYTFTGLTAGTYTVTASLPGYTFSPSAPQPVSVGTSTTVNFTETSAQTSYSISGTVSYGGAKTGRVFILVQPSGCTNCNAVAGTSIALTGSAGSMSGTYTVRGLLPSGAGQSGNGSFTVFAFMDISTLNTGIQNDSDPSGSDPSTVMITNANVTGANVTLTDPTLPAPVTPDSTQISVSPGNGVAVIQYKAPTDSNGVEIASSYNVYYGATNPPTSVKNFKAQGRNGASIFILSGLANGATNFQVSALVGATESAKSTVISTTIGATTGSFTVSGVVTVPAGTGNGPLYVGVYGGASGHSIYVDPIPTPYTSPVSYSISGVPNGTYQNFAVIDEDSDGEINVPDLDNVGNHSNPPTIVVNNGNVTNANLDLTPENVPSSVTVSTIYQTSYSLNFQVNWGTKRPVAIAMISGPNVPVPLDMTVDEHNSMQSPTLAVTPTVGDTYQFQVTYADASTGSLTSAVTAVYGANNIVQSIGETTTSPYSPTAPLFTWTAPLQPPSGTYYYSICVNNQNGTPSLNWCDYGHGSGNGLPSSQTSIQYNADGSASSSTLGASGSKYSVTIAVIDSNGNNAITNSTYTVP